MILLSVFLFCYVFSFVDQDVSSVEIVMDFKTPRETNPSARAPSTIQPIVPPTPSVKHSTPVNFEAHSSMTRSFVNSEHFSTTTPKSVTEPIVKLPKDVQNLVPTESLPETQPIADLSSPDSPTPVLETDSAQPLLIIDSSIT